jgi:AbiV family abortive infection protein
METFPIPWTEALEGCRLAIDNAERLAEDSEVLRRNDRLQSAYSVSLDAWEELGKAIVLFRYYQQKKNISEGDWFQVLRDHKSKRVAYVKIMDSLYGSTPPMSIEQLKHEIKKVTEEKKWRKWFTLERQVGVHVDWVGAHWRSPCRIDKEWFGTFPFNSEYWAFSVKASCKFFRDKLRELNI